MKEKRAQLFSIDHLPLNTRSMAPDHASATPTADVDPTSLPLPPDPPQTDNESSTDGSLSQASSSLDVNSTPLPSSPSLAPVAAAEGYRDDSTDLDDSSSVMELSEGEESESDDEGAQAVVPASEGAVTEDAGRDDGSVTESDGLESGEDSEEEEEEEP